MQNSIIHRRRREVPHSLPFEDRRQTLSDPDAERREAARGAGASHLVEYSKNLKSETLKAEKADHIAHGAKRNHMRGSRRAECQKSMISIT